MIFIYILAAIVTYFVFKIGVKWTEENDNAPFFLDI